MSQRHRRNFLRRAHRRAFFRAWRSGERYCRACGDYRTPREFTGGNLRTCDPCRGLRHCRRCRQDQPFTDFATGDDMCSTCRSYRLLTVQEREAFETFLANDDPSERGSGDQGVTLGRDPAGRRVRLSPGMRRRHLSLLGQAGSGTTTLMKNLVIQDMLAGHGCGVVDLRGDLATDLLGLVPPARLPVVTYFAPATGHGPTFNPLALPYPPQVIVDDMLEVFRTFFADDWGPEVEHLLQFGLLTLLGDRAPHTLADLYTLYVAPAYRSALADASPSPRLRAFWRNGFAPAEHGALERIATRLAAFLTPLSPLERLFSIAENGLDFEAMMDGSHVFIANLSNEALGRDSARLLAVLLIKALTRAVRARVERERGRLADFSLYLPEFQDCITSGLDTLATNCARAGVNLTLAYQRLGELSAELGDAVLECVGTVAAFQVSAEDAVRLQPVMHTRRPARASTGELYDHEVVRRATAAPVRARVRALLASPCLFVGEAEPSYEGSCVDALLEEVKRVRSMPLPDDLIEVDWPSIADFTERAPLTALVRIDGTDQVTALTVERPPQPDAHTRAAILERPHRREPLGRGHFDATAARPGPQRGREGRPLPRRKRWRRAIRTLRRPRR